MQSLKVFFNNSEVKLPKRKRSIKGMRLVSLTDGLITIKFVHTNGTGTFICALLRKGVEYLHACEEYYNKSLKSIKPVADIIFSKESFEELEREWKIDLEDIYIKHLIPKDEKLALELSFYQ